MFLRVVTAALVVGLGNASVGAAKLEGAIKIDGSSTVAPISEAVAEEFNKIEPKVRLSVGVSGTGGGFKKFTAGEIDISDASRPIKESEKQIAKEKGIEFVELAVAYDALTIVVHKDNNWVDHLTVAELKKMWMPESKVKTWKDVRATWPARDIKLFGPGTDSGTFDYFTEAINGKAQVSRNDFTKSEDDNMLVQGVGGSKDGLGYFGFAYYEGNKAKLKAVPIDGGKGPVMPSDETIKNNKYAPLGRPIFIYVSKKAVKRPEVVQFVEFYLKNAAKLSKQVGYTPLENSKYTSELEKFMKFTK